MSALPDVYSVSYDQFMEHIRQIPRLGAKEEYELALHYRETGDVKAAHKLVTSNLRYVASVANDYRYYGLMIEDLFQEGTVGLMKAVKNFDPSVGVKLVTFASHYIKSEILNFILSNWKIVKVATTKAQQKLFFNISKFKKTQNWFTGDEVDDIATTLSVTPDDVRNMEAKMHTHNISLDVICESEGDGDYTYPELELPAPDQYQPEAIAIKDEATNIDIMQTLSVLNERDQDIIRSRWLQEPAVTFEVLAKRYGVSHQRIAQLEKKALVKLKKGLTALFFISEENITRKLEPQLTYR